MQKTINVCTFAALSCLFAASASAADSGIYLGGAISQSNIETEDDFLGFGSAFEDDDTGYKLFGGVRLLDAFAIEASYVDFGSISFDNNIATDGFRGQYEATALDAFAVGFVGIGVVEAFGKLGLVYWDADARLQGGLGGLDLSDSESGTDIAFGVGGQFNLGSVSLRLEYENFNVSGIENLDMWSLGLTYTFF